MDDDSSSGGSDGERPARKSKKMREAEKELERLRKWKMKTVDKERQERKRALAEMREKNAMRRGREAAKEEHNSSGLSPLSLPDATQPTPRYVSPSREGSATARRPGSDPLTMHVPAPPDGRPQSGRRAVSARSRTKMRLMTPEGPTKPPHPPVIGASPGLYDPKLNHPPRWGADPDEEGEVSEKKVAAAKKKLIGILKESEGNTKTLNAEEREELTKRLYDVPLARQAAFEKNRVIKTTKPLEPKHKLTQEMMKEQIDKLYELEMKKAEVKDKNRLKKLEGRYDGLVPHPKKLTQDDIEALNQRIITVALARTKALNEAAARKSEITLPKKKLTQRQQDESVAHLYNKEMAQQATKHQALLKKYVDDTQYHAKKIPKETLEAAAVEMYKGKPGFY